MAEELHTLEQIHQLIEESFPDREWTGAKLDKFMTVEGVTQQAIEKGYGKIASVVVYCTAAKYHGKVNDTHLQYFDANKNPITPQQYRDDIVVKTLYFWGDNQ